jgi:predicted dehydrogenase
MPDTSSSNPAAEPSDLSRRDFLRGGSAAALLAWAGGVPVQAAAATNQVAAGVVNPDGTTNYKGEAVPVHVGIVGCGPWGREILKTLAGLTNGPVVAVCDTYANALKRAGTLAPDAHKYENHQQLLADPTVEAVVVATPSHQHQDVVQDALKAGKHVYCEAPLAASLQDARAIAQVARASTGVYFQAGLQNRADKQILNLATFIRTGVLGRPLKARQQFHKKQSWRVPAPTPDREKAVNWRLDRGFSPGLVGEFGVHQLDLANWFFLARPVAVTGLGAVSQWRDGRDVPDNVVAVFEYPGGVFLTYEASLGNSFDGELSLFFGSDCAVMVRDRRAWMFQELDAPQLGWEVFAKRDAFYKESGIVLAAGYSKQAPTTTAPATASLDEKSALQYALEAFLVNAYNHQTAVRDFNAAYDPKDLAALKEYLASLEQTRLPAAGWAEGYESAVTVIKANEAVLNQRRIAFAPDWFALG